MEDNGFGHDDVVEELDSNVEDDFEQEDPEIEIIDEHEPVAEESSSEIENIPEKPKHKERVRGKTRINQLTREKYQAENEAAILRAENERLRQLTEVSNNAAMQHYDKSVQLRLDRAMQLKTEALQNEDIEAQVKADLELSRVAAQMEQLQAYKAQQQRTQQQYTPTQEQQYNQYQQQDYQEPEVELNETTENWLAENQWFVPGSDEYDSEMEQEVKAYADALDRRYKRNGKANKILSDEYFDEINNYVAREFYEQPNISPRNNKSNLTMKPITNRAPVAPVSRSGHANIKKAPIQVALTAEERDFARQIGISQQAYALQKAESMKFKRDQGR